MLNQAVIVGRVESFDFKTEVPSVLLAVVRNYKEDGEENYATDYIKVYLTKSLIKDVKKYITTDTILAVKARIIQPKGAVASSILAEKISFM